MADFLGELAALARDRVEVRALLREFHNSDSIIARCQIDEAATLLAGHVVMHSEPSDCFGRALAAVLAKDGITDKPGMHHDGVASQPLG
jgi:hypothetical protein